MLAAHASASDFITPAVFFGGSALLILGVAALKKRPLGELALVIATGIPGVYLASLSGSLDRPILLVPAIVLAAGSFGVQFYFFFRERRRQQPPPPGRQE